MKKCAVIVALVYGADALIAPSAVVTVPRSRVVVADAVDPTIVAAGVGAVAIAAGAVFALGGGGGDNKAPPVTPKPKPEPKLEKNSPAPKTVVTSAPSSPVLVKACWSGDAFKSLEWADLEPKAPTIESWREACASGVVSYYDFGLRVLSYQPPTPVPEPAPVTLEDWKAACETGGVQSFYDFGLRLA